MEYYNKIDETYLKALKQHTIRPVFKVELMDFAENVIGELTQDISKEDSGSISVNYQQGVRRSCSLTLLNVNDNLKLKRGKYLLDENGLWINTKFKLYTGIKIFKFDSLQQEIDYNNQNEDVLHTDNDTDLLLYRNNAQKTEEDFYWFSQGVYLLTDMYEFSAERKNVDGTTFTPAYTIESWDNSSSVWVKTLTSSDDSCILRQLDSAVPRRIVWKWHKEGFSVILR